MKRTVILLLVTLLLFSLCACGTQKSIAPSDIVGTYQWEKDGFGGPFTITLNADGTYVYYVGMLSSYIGIGTWSLEEKQLTMTEETTISASSLLVLKENVELCGYPNLFCFIVEKDTLRYIAEKSDEFMYVTVENGDAFKLTDNTDTKK